VFAEEKKNPPVTVRVARVNALLGLDLSADQVKAIIMRTGSTVEDVDAETFVCVGPWERTDLLIEADFVEEVGRLYGLDNIVSVTPDTATPADVNPRQFYSEQVRQTLLSLGFSEVITSSFQNKDKIQLQNALASDKSYVRSSLRKNITKVLDENFFHMDLLAIRSVLVFEIGTVFYKVNVEDKEGALGHKTETGVGEHPSLALGVRQKGNGYTPKDDAPLQAALAELSEVLGVTLDFTVEQGVAEINLSDVIVSLPVPGAYGELTKRTAATYAPVSPYPAMARDIALWVSEGTTADVVVDTLRTPAGNLCVRVDLFDEFTKDGRTSFAFRLVFQAFDRTLTDSAVQTIMDDIYQVVGDKDWEVR
jgi:phenylalanyl-tRNA synthetase beta chain